MPDVMLQVEITQRLFGGLVLGFLEGFLELAVENVFFLAFSLPGIAELVFPFARLLRQDARGVADINVGGSLGRHHVRKHGSPYLEGQAYLEPHPKELMLRNHV